MRGPLDDGRLQATASVSLLQKSHLVEWSQDSAQFKALDRSSFEKYCKEFDPVFGRLMCWMLFSAGAELLAKGVCLVNGVEVRKGQWVPQYPQGKIADWAHLMRANWTTVGMISTTPFRTIGSLTSRGKKKTSISPLESLCDRKSATVEQTDLIFAAYELLGKTIRNRDAHAYVPNIRDSHHGLVNEIFVKALNLLVGWLPKHGFALNTNGRDLRMRSHSSKIWPLTDIRRNFRTVPF
jgi:hypothetical protein